MIQTNELRIGNLIIENGNITEVENLINGKINYQNYHTHDPIQEPIPLSEEILLKIGFVNEFSNSWSNNVLQMFQNKGNVAGCDIGDFYVSTGQRYVTSFKHLHQLQNLYFALTGSELNTSGLTKND